MKKRFLARQVIDVFDNECGLSIVEFDCTTGCSSIYPFENEIHSTSFVDGTIIVEKNRLLLRQADRKDQIIAEITII